MYASNDKPTKLTNEWSRTPRSNPTSFCYPQVLLAPGAARKKCRPHCRQRGLVSSPFVCIRAGARAATHVGSAYRGGMCVAGGGGGLVAPFMYTGVYFVFEKISRLHIHIWNNTISSTVGRNIIFGQPHSTSAICFVFMMG